MSTFDAGIIAVLLAIPVTMLVVMGLFWLAHHDQKADNRPYGGGKKWRS